MVSNYVKQRLIPAPEKKLYTAEHLSQLLFIAAVKPVFIGYCDFHGWFSFFSLWVLFSGLSSRVISCSHFSR